MPLHVNDTILYGIDGVCKVVAEIEKEFYGQKKNYYVLKPVRSSGATIYVPAHNAKTNEKIRPLLTAEEIYALIHSMSHEESITIPADASKRDKFYSDTLVYGDRAQLVRLIRALYVRNEERAAEGKRPLAADARCMKEAETQLYEEFAYVMDILPEDVLPFILEQVEVSAKSSTSKKAS